MLIYIACLLACFAGTTQTSVAQVTTAATPTEVGQPDIGARVEVRILALKSTLTAGEEVQLRVEVWNLGSQDAFICKDFQDAVRAYCTIRFTLSNSSGSFGPQILSAGDEFPVKRETFLNALATHWIAIPPNHFYGTVLKLDPTVYPVLQKPGRYQIKGEYRSAGFFAESYMNSLLTYRSEIEQLPYKAWQGVVETNAVAVKVAPKKN